MRTSGRGQAESVRRRGTGTTWRPAWVAMLGILAVAGAVGAEGPTPPRGLPERIFEMPTAGPAAAARTLHEIEQALPPLYRVIGGYPPRYESEAHRESVWSDWRAVMLDAEAQLEAVLSGERRHALLAEIYRMGHNLDVRGSAKRAAEHVEACVAAFPSSVRCHLSSMQLHLAPQRTGTNLASAKRSIDALRALAKPGSSEPAESGLVFYHLYSGAREEAHTQLDRYRALFPESGRSAMFERLHAVLAAQTVERKAQDPKVVRPAPASP